MRRKIAVFLIAVLAFAGVASAFAESVKLNLSKEDLSKLVIDVKNRIGITHNYEEFDSNQYSDGNRNVIEMNWHDEKATPISINVTCDNSGNILNVQYYYEEADNAEFTLSYEAGEKIAMSYFKKVNPKVYGEYKPVKLNEVRFPFTDTLSYGFMRYHDGVPVIDDTAAVNVRLSDKKVVGFWMNYNDKLDFSQFKNAVDLKTAKDALVASKALRLAQSAIYENGEFKGYKTVYTPQFFTYYIDAVTGKPVVIDRHYGIARGFSAMDTAAAEEKSALSPEEMKDIEQTVSSKDQAAAEKRARDLFEISDKLKLNSISMFNYATGGKGAAKVESKNYSITFQNMGSYAYVQMEAKSLKPYAFNMYDDNDPAMISKDKAKSIAESSLRRWMAIDKNYACIDNYRADEDYSHGFDYYYVNEGAIVLDRVASATVSGSNKKVTDFHLSREENPLSKPIDKIGEKKAYEIMFANAKFDKFYTYSENEEGSVKLHLVYGFIDSFRKQIDTQTGEVISANTDELYSIYEYSDVNESKNADAVKFLALVGIGYDGGKLSPKKAMKQADFAKFIHRLIYTYARFSEHEDMNKAIYDNLVKAKIVMPDEIKPESELDRLTMAKWLVRACGYEDVAKIGSIYNNVFKDSSAIGTENLGYVNLATGLKLIDIELKGDFMPSIAVTRDDGLIAIYKLISNKLVDRNFR